MLLINVGLPLLLYYTTRNTIGVVYALVLSGAPPFIWVIINFIQHRHIDILGSVLCLSFVLSGAISIASGDERAALIRDSAVSCAVGTIFLASLLPIRTRWFEFQPFTYSMGRQMLTKVRYNWTDRDGNPQDQEVVVWYWEHIPEFKKHMYGISAGWGIALVMQLIACVLMVEASNLSVDQIVMVNNIITGNVTGIMVAVTVASGIYIERLVKKIGPDWIAENDFTDKFAERQEGRQDRNDDNMA
ncbi:hypothetical protein BJV82DRAFT_692582 [Fennellomyces sp. T-0311]|nr:hypothetical protein BJV82DRAFT_692582 [Fennellomyces sp. T-0311]